MQVIEQRTHDAIGNDIQRVIELHLPRRPSMQTADDDYARSAFKRLLETEYYAQLERKMIMALAEWILPSELSDYESKTIGVWVFE